jgi:probable HAF family extracellular repeat protein
MKARLFGISLLLLTAACRDTNSPTQLAAPTDPSKIISDGAHGGNKDFFFLPPMVPLPLNNPDFELGKFNNSLRSALKVEICELKSENLNSQGLPTATTGCVAGAPIKTFPTGSINLVNVPVKQSGWWTLYNLPPDGFYYVLWDTRQSNLNVNKYYRIKVLIDGATEPLGVADVDPMSNIFQWKYTLTGQVIQLVDGVMLPIPFRVEKGGGSALCGGANLCVSTTISNSSPTGSQTVTVDGGAGAIAGVRFPNGWLPANGPQNVVVTIAQVDIGTTDPVTGTSTKPCHIGLPLQQFPGCFNFTTTPHLAAIDESGRQFAVPVTVAVCYSLQSSGDPREKFAEMYASGPNEPPHALQDASDAGLLSPTTRNCSTAPVIGSNQSRGMTQFATAGWRRLKSGVGSLLGVKTAYAVDLGLGGIATAFSNIGPALAATIQPVGSTALSANPGETIQAYVRITGTNNHDGQHANSVGLSGITVHFAAADGNAAIGQLGETPGTATQLDVVTNSVAIDPQSPVSGGGYAAVNYRVPSAPGVYHLSADGAAFGGPVTFSITVTAPPVAAATDLGAMPGYPNSYAVAINDLGHVIGNSEDQNSNSIPFIWINGQLSELGSFSGRYSQATGINANDDIVGYSRVGANTLEYRAFRWRRGAFIDLGIFPGRQYSIPVGINSSGQIAGYSGDTAGSAPADAWIYQSGVMTGLGSPGNGYNFTPTAINDAGQIVGNGFNGVNERAFVWQNGSFTMLAATGAKGTHAFGINGNGVIVGSMTLDNNDEHAARWVNGVIEDLGLLPGDHYAQAEGVSADGRIVGLSYGGTGRAFRAFLWQAGRMTELPPLGGNFAEATAINGVGLIAGQSTIVGGGGHAVLWQAPSP